MTAAAAAYDYILGQSRRLRGRVLIAGQAEPDCAISADSLNRPSGGAMSLEAWLRRLNLSQYEAVFQENSVTADLLPSLTAEDLKDLGITAVGHRRRLLDAIAALRRDTTAAATTDSHVQPDQIYHHPASPAPERRHISVMFCDLVDSTGLASRLDPEDLSAVIRRYQACVAREIERFGGFIARYVGDGVLIYFGWPVARENDAERAIRAALAVVAELAQAQIDNERLRVRIGIATGLVVIGEQVGSGEALQQTAIGETPNLAARLQALAGDEGVVIDAATRAQIGGLFDCADLGFVELKGIPGAVQVFQVLKEATVSSRFEALHSTVLTPLVGRDEELELLLRRWAQVKTGTGRVVMVAGEPGIGKSRLVAEFEERLKREDHARLRYFCADDHADSPLYPFIRQLSLSANFDQRDADAAKWLKLRTLVGPDAPAQDSLLLGDLLGLTSEWPVAAETNSRLQRERTFAALLGLMERLCHERPLLIVIEDIHFADPTTRDLVDLAISRLAELPVLLIMTFRPELQLPWTGHAGVTLITLNRLDRKDSVQLAGLLANQLPAMLLNRIAVRADGVPLFVEELAKHWAERAHDPDSALQTIGVPTTLQGSLLARLDRLANAKQAAQIGAVIGREFSYDLIAAIADLPEPILIAGLDQLVSAGLAHCRGAPPAATYRFKHTLVQRAVYATLLRQHRQQAHSRIADVLSDRTNAEPQVLAHHLTEAGRVEEALQYWLLAGQRVAGRSAEREAINLFRRGLAALPTLPESEQRNRRELEFQLALQTPLIAIEGENAEAVRSLRLRILELDQGTG
jgi:class 3 adenylate cyclase